MFRKAKSMREIVLDTETTGLDPRSGHRIVEIGCLELKNYIPTGREYHAYINPERSMPEEAFNVHGLSEEFLSSQPLFRDVVEGFLEFIQESPLIIHNAKFDMKFLNAELEWLKHPQLPFERAVDTLKMARRKFPGSPASLDALCKRFDVDTSNRQKHGALIDSELLAAVYLELIGGKQPGLLLDDGHQDLKGDEVVAIERTYREARIFLATDAEKQRHKDMVSKLKEPLWGSS